MTPITVHVPVREESGPALPAGELAPRDGLPAGARLTLIANGKPKARELLEFFGEELREQLGLGSVTVFAKPAASSPISPEEARTIAAQSDLVLTGLGDCGACSACSLHDAAQLEQLGVPAIVVITEPFQRPIAEFARGLGLPGYPVVVVPHPVSSRDLDVLARIAAEAAPVAAQQLTGSRAPALIA